METLLSLSEAGKLVGVSKSTIWRAVKSGKLSAAAKTD
jgi:excisionase family DNA binding protein